MAKDAKGHGSDKRDGGKLSTAAQERIAINRSSDRNLYHNARADVPAHSLGVSKIGITPPVSDKAVAAAAAARGGFSVTPRGESPSDGHMVALQGRTMTVDPATLRENPRAVLEHYVKSNADVFKDPTVHIGGWEHNGLMHIDPAEHVINRGTAMNLGRARNQISIYDVKNNKEIPTGGTGK